MTNAEIVKGIKCCMLIDYSCNECPYYQYGKTCNTMLYIDVMKFLPPITPETLNNKGKFNAHETLLGKALDAGHIYR